MDGEATEAVEATFLKFAFGEYFGGRLLERCTWTNWTYFKANKKSFYYFLFPYGGTSVTSL